MASTTDRIEKKRLLRAPLQLVCGAISDSSQFGKWFGARIDGPFIAGQRATGKFVPTSADSEAAKSQKQFEGMPFEWIVDRVEPMRFFSLRWHPMAVEPGVDYSKEPTTLVEFKLEEAAGGTMLTVIESGFDQIPLERRAKAYNSHEQGWTMQLELIEKYLARS
jgi:uncharacterized protein YndB with AHSA1/START domain